MMSAEERKELFVDAAQRKQAEKIEADERRKGNYSYDPMKYGPLYMQKFASFRFLGNPADKRLGDATSPKTVSISMITGDDDKRFRCIWPGQPTGKDAGGRNWILGKIFNKVLAHTWNTGSNSRDYHHQETHPTIFNRVYKNGRPDITFEKGWAPEKRVMMNVIDRNKMDWQRKEKHTVHIAKKVSEGRKDNEGKSNFFYEGGLPYTVYNEIFDTIVGAYGDWENYDIVVYKNNELPFYRVLHGVDEFTKLKAQGGIFTDEYLMYAGELLTDEEREWERYDLDKAYQITTYKRIASKLGIFIEQVDQIFNTKYSEELKDLVEVEKQEKKAEKADQESTSTPVAENVLNKNDFAEGTKTNEFVNEDAEKKAGPVFNDVEDKLDEAPVAAAAPVRQRAKKEEPVELINWEELTESYPGVAGMTEEEKALVTGFDSKNGTFTYNPGESLFACPTEGCTMQTPQNFIRCPICEVEFA